MDGQHLDRRRARRPLRPSEREWGNAIRLSAPDVPRTDVNARFVRVTSTTVTVVGANCQLRRARQREGQTCREAGTQSHGALEARQAAETMENPRANITLPCPWGTHGHPAPADAGRPRGADRAGTQHDRRRDDRESGGRRRDHGDALGFRQPRRAKVDADRSSVELGTVSLRRSRGRSPAFASTRTGRTPAPTSGTSGAPRVLGSRRRSSRLRRVRAGRRSPSRLPWRSRRASLHGLVPRAAVATPRLPRSTGPRPAAFCRSSRRSGVYTYGRSSSFPTKSWNASQYWVDVTFVPTSSSVGSQPTPAPVVNADADSDSHSCSGGDADSHSCSGGDADADSDSYSCSWCPTAPTPAPAPVQVGGSTPGGCGRRATRVWRRSGRRRRC